MFLFNSFTIFYFLLEKMLRPNENTLYFSILSIFLINLHYGFIISTILYLNILKRLTYP